MIPQILAMWRFLNCYNFYEVKKKKKKAWKEVAEIGVSGELSS